MLNAGCATTAVNLHLAILCAYIAHYLRYKDVIVATRVVRRGEPGL